jgi:hypothetical protein
MIRRFALATTALFLLAAPAQAQTYNSTSQNYDYNTSTSMPELSPLSGFYAGGFGGYDWSSVETGSGADFDVDGSDYGLFVGYSLDTLLNNNLGLGINASIEGHYAWSSADDEFTVAGIPLSAEKQHEWGISFRPGLSFINSYMPLDMKPYAILGYREAEFETTIGGVKNSESLHGFELGVGSEVIAFKDFGVRLDLSHVFYDNKDGLEADETDLRLGAAYHF